MIWWSSFLAFSFITTRWVRMSCDAIGKFCRLRNFWVLLFLRPKLLLLNNCKGLHSTHCLEIALNEKWLNVAFEFWHFSPFLVLWKVIYMVTLFDHKLQIFKNPSKLTIFWPFKSTFVHSKCKHSSLRSQCWMRLFLWFSTRVIDFLQRIVHWSSKSY